MAERIYSYVDFAAVSLFCPVSARAPLSGMGLQGAPIEDCGCRLWLAALGDSEQLAQVMDNALKETGLQPSLGL